MLDCFREMLRSIPISQCLGGDFKVNKEVPTIWCWRLRPLFRHQNKVSWGQWPRCLLSSSNGLKLYCWFSLTSDVHLSSKLILRLQGNVKVKTALFDILPDCENTLTAVQISFVKHPMCLTWLLWLWVWDGGVEKPLDFYTVECFVSFNAPMFVRRRRAGWKHISKGPMKVICGEVNQITLHLAVLCLHPPPSDHCLVSLFIGRRAPVRGEQVWEQVWSLNMMLEVFTQTYWLSKFLKKSVS